MHILEKCANLYNFRYLVVGIYMKRWLLLLIIPFIVGCQKKGPAMRCIYDQSVFADACVRAVNDEVAFAGFKREPFYSLLYQSYSYEEGCAFLREIESEYPDLIAQFDRLRSSDRIGDPKVYDYGGYGAFSPTTLRAIQVAGMVQNNIGPCKRVIQIGAGYGGLCKILKDLGLWDSYAIVDLPEHIALAQKVLEKEGITGVDFYTLDTLPSAGTYDLVLSDLHFSEFSRPLQKMFLDRIAAHSGLILGHTFPKHFGVEPLSAEQIRVSLEKKEYTLFKSHCPQGERADYYFLWKS